MNKKISDIIASSSEYVIIASNSFINKEWDDLTISEIKKAIERGVKVDFLISNGSTFEEIDGLSMHYYKESTLPAQFIVIDGLHLWITDGESSKIVEYSSNLSTRALFKFDKMMEHKRT